MGSKKLDRSSWPAGSLGTVVAIAWLVVAAAGCCGCGQPDNECSPGQAYCDDQGNGYDCSLEERMYSMPWVWSKTAECGRADLCKVDNGEPFCIIDPAIAPKCPEPDGVQCIGDGALDCAGGYAATWVYCPGQCEPDTGCRDAHTAKEPCGDAGTCAGDLECIYGQCDARCSCPAGAECESCYAYLRMGGTNAVATCLDGWCNYGP